MRSEADILAGVIRAPSRTGERILPTLSIEDSEAWRQQAVDAGLHLLKTEGDLAGFAAAAGASVPTVVALIAAYDQGGVLGGAKGIAKTFDAMQAWRLLRDILAAEFPFVGDLQGVLAVLGPTLQQRPASYDLPRSSNGPATPTDSPPDPSDDSSAGSRST